MAELFADPSFWKSNGQQPAGNYTGNPEIDRELDQMPEEERQAAIAEITAPPTGEEVAGMIQSKLAVGEVANVTREEYRLYKAYSKTKETDIMEAIGMGADMVWNDLQKAAGSMYDKPIESVVKLTPSLIEAFTQGTRSMYGMLAESQDPNSVLFRAKNAIFTGSDEDAEYEQFMQALDFNAKSTRLMQGKETIVMDKDLINPEVTQAMSYIADPSLFIPFEGVALKGAQLIGMAEGIAKASARATAIKQMVIGGTLRWGVGAPIEAVGGATRATIDAAIDRGSRAISAVTGMQPSEIATTARMTGLGTVAAEAAGMSVPFGSGVAEAYLGASTARGIGEAIGAVGEQMMKGERGVLSYAQQALRESAEGGAKLTPQAENLLKAIDFVDPMFSYTADVTKGATQGAFIGGGLGYLGGGEEGMAQGIGAGAVLGGVGAGFGRIYADISGATKTDRMRITTDLGLNILAETNPTQAKDYATLRAVAQAKGINVDGYISGLLKIAPDLDTYFKSGIDHAAEITARGFDPNTYDGSFVDQNGRRLFSMAEFEKAEGFVIDKAKDGRVTFGVNLDNLKKNTVPHEAFHTIFRSVVMEPEFQKRMTESVLGAFDKDGKQISAPRVSQDEALGFFLRYLKALHKGPKYDEQKKILTSALAEYYRDGQAKIMAEDGKTPYLANLSEEFGAYYFTQFIEGKPLDYLFLGGELGGVRGIMQSVQDGWLDYWEGRAKRVEPKFNMANPDGIDYAFKPKGGKRVRVGAIDYLMQDLVRAATQRRQDGSINLSRMSRDTREQFLRSQGLDGVGETRAKPFRPSASKGQDSVKIYNKTFGPEVHKAILALPDNLRPAVDGNGDFVGPLSKEVIEQMVSTGHVSREMGNKIQVLQDMANGTMQSNIAEMGYVGWSMQQDVGPNPPRVYGSEVPYKRRKVLVLGVESKIGPKGMSFTAKTLDWQVIETRANNLWSDSRVRNRWNDDRGVFVQDFFRYLSNASKTDAQGRVPSNKLWAQDGDIKRDVMQQMAGIPKQAGETYAHPPVAEIHEDILNSVMNLTVNRMSDVRVTGDNVFFDADKAAPFIRVNMKVADMPYEDTPNGKVFTDKSSGFRFTQTAKGVTAFDRHGEFIGSYANLEDAGKFAKRVYERQQAAMKQVAMQVTDEASRGITHKSKAQFVDDSVTVTKDETVKAQVVQHLEAQLKPDADNWNQSINRAIEAVKTEGLSGRVVQEVAAAVPVEYNGQKLYLSEHIKAEQAPANAAWEAMFPRTFRSRLLDKVQSLHKANPNLSNQALIKKLLRDSSNGYRFYAEAEASGLIDFLRSQINPAQSIQKQRDARGNWTGGIKTVDKPFSDSKIRGGRTDLPIDLEAITDFIKNNEITLMVDSGAREVSGFNTTNCTWEGTWSDYNETALRVPKKYSHGVKGHYGEAVAHHRSTVRTDVNGERVRYIEEFQAQNAQEREKVNKLTPDDVKQLKEKSKIYKQFLDEGLKTGAFVANAVQGGAGPYSAVNEALSAFKILAGNIDAVFGGKILSDPIWNNYGEITSKTRGMGLDSGEVLTVSPEDMADPSKSRTRHIAILGNMLGLSDYIQSMLGDFRQTNNPVANAEKLIKLIEAGNIRTIRADIGTGFIEPHVKIPEIKSRIIDILNAFINQEKLYEKYKFVIERIPFDNPHVIGATLTDIETKLQQHELFSREKPFPLEDPSEWAANLAKDIITKTVADGDDLITLTHPDDAPTKSGFEYKPRHATYGKIFPEIIQKIVGKYGIEVKQRNELPALAKEQLAVDKAYRDATDARNKAQSNAIDEFKKTQGQGESPDVISELSRQFLRTAEDLHKEFPDAIGLDWMQEKIMPLLGQVKSDALRNKLTDVAQKVADEALMFGGAKDAIYSQYDPSVIAIDRGMSFRLNKEIKEAVMNGELRTAYKPEEEPQPIRLSGKMKTIDINKKQGGRTYAKREFNEEFIGRYASENPDVTKGLNISVTEENDIINVELRDKRDRLIGAFNSEEFSKDGKGHHTIEIAVDSEHRNKGYGKLLMSEMAERLRSKGVIWFEGHIVDEAGRPYKIREKVIGNTKVKIADNKSGRPLGWIGVNEITPRYAERTQTVGNQLDPQAWYKPEEGGRTYTDIQMEDEFIGRYAAENQSLLKNLTIGYFSRDGEGVRGVEGDLDTSKFYLELKTKDAGDLVGEIEFEFERSSTFFNGTEDVNGLIIRDISVNIQPDYRGKGYQHLLYSELLERARASGAIGFTQNIENLLGLPLKSVRKITGEDGSKIWTLRDWEPVNPTQDNFDRLMANAPQMKDYRGNHAPYVQNNGRLDPQAWYKPEEGDAPLRVNFSPDEVKKNLRSLQSAIDRQSDADKVPAGIKKGVGRLIQAVERQRKEDVKTMPQAVKEGFKALADAVDAQADMDKVPAGVRKGLRLLFEAAQYEDLKPQQAMPKPTASEEQLASGIEALGRAVGVKGQVRRQPKPQAKPNTPPTASMPEPPPLPTRPTPEPSSTAWMSWTQEKTENGGFIRNALGYVIVVNKDKFKVYNPAKVLVGIYEDEESAKRRVLKDMPRR